MNSTDKLMPLKIGYRQLITMGNNKTYYMEVYEIISCSMRTPRSTGYYVAFTEKEPMWLVNIFDEFNLNEFKERLLNKYNLGETISYYPLTPTLKELTNDIEELIKLSYEQAAITPESLDNDRNNQIRILQDNIAAIELTLNQMKLTLETLINT